jgi:hypothetical protein
LWSPYLKGRSIFNRNGLFFFILEKILLGKALQNKEHDYSNGSERQEFQAPPSSFFAFTPGAIDPPPSQHSCIQRLLTNIRKSVLILFIIR